MGNTFTACYSYTKLIFLNLRLQKETARFEDKLLCWQKMYAFMSYTEACKQVTNLFDNKYIINLR